MYIFVICKLYFLCLLILEKELSSINFIHNKLSLVDFVWCVQDSKETKSKLYNY